jgi:hypothetical protein
MGGGDRKANWNRDVLERIVALLFALAGLADRAAGAPFHRRRQVLGILSHGEAEARAFLFGAGAPVPSDTPGEAADAARLAIRLRALALVLCVMLSQAATFALPGAAVPPTGREKPARRVGRQATASAPDTS